MNSMSAISTFCENMHDALLKSSRKEIMRGKDLEQLMTDCDKDCISIEQRVA